jgi:hypothetical protein
MSPTLVIQSHRDPLPYDWLRFCQNSVSAWAQTSGYDYQFIGDEIFDLIDPGLVDKVGDQVVIASDLARLKCLQRGLTDGYESVIWCDADFLVFDSQNFLLPASDFVLGREVWVQADEDGKLRAYSKVHNAFLMFRRGNHFLDFYCDTAERLLRLNQGNMPPQFIGPKLLSALHNIAQCPVMEIAGMLSPLVMKDLLTGRGKALELFQLKSPAVLAGANLSSSLAQREGLGEVEMEAVIGRLLGEGV